MSKRILTGVYPDNDYRFYLRHNDIDMKYGLPDKKKYPMPDRDHVMSAIKFFNYVSPGDEKELARNILKRIREYGIKDIHVGDNNRFGKYYKQDYLEHHGILGQRWGVRRYQNDDGSLTNAGKTRYSDNKKQSRFDRTDWNAFGVVKARKDYKKAQSHDESNKVRAKYEKAIKDLEKRQMKEGSEIDWNSKKGRAIETRHLNEQIKLRSEAKRALIIAKLMDSGYSKKSSESGADWMIKNGYNLSFTDGTWGGSKSRR